ncbi:MAG: hypothetical protein QOI08_2534 [Actinomycetota bacterium]|jgi:hypothetical protein|nr:hypothetical protein [Actinomycetota bacterium]
MAHEFIEVRDEIEHTSPRRKDGPTTRLSAGLRLIALLTFDQTA